MGKRIIKTGIYIVLLLHLPTCHLHAQSPTDTLKNVIVKDHAAKTGDVRSNDFAPGLKIVSIDSSALQQYQMQNVATMLSQQLPVFIKSYGVNGLSSISFRGASAAQSAVYWNGVPIQNAALGIADIGELPVMFMNRVNIVYGSSAALWGSGNVGGALMLESDPFVFDSGRRSLSLSGAMGSFGQYSGGLEGSINNKKMYLSIKYITQTANNNFSYTDENGNNLKMTNSNMTDHALQLRLGCKISPNSILGFSVWYQQYNREIPPALFETSSDKNEDDKSLRLLLDWNGYSGSNKWFVKSGFIKDDINYNDSALMMHTANSTYQYYQEAGWKKQLYDYGQILVFIPMQFSWTNSGPTLETIIRQALAVGYDITMLQQKLNIAINARDEVYNGTNNILLPGADASYNLASWLAIKANVQKTYREPTLNELYYNPGGNPSLKPEQGWNEDGGYTLKAKKGRFDFYSDGAVFNRMIQNWVIWLGGAIWTPHNIAEVHSRGAETENNVTYTTGKWKFHIGGSTSYVLSTTESNYIPNNGSIGKQIPYTPRYNGVGNIGLEYKDFYFAYIETYTGYRFITFDESEYLKPYATGNLQMMYKMQIADHGLQMTLQCNNVFNEQYQVVAYRPMPGINWLAGIKLILI